MFSAQRRIRGERYARHWHDLAAIARISHFAAVLSDRVVAEDIAKHKFLFFSEKDADGSVIDYFAATSGHLKIVLEGKAKDALEADYKAKLAEGMMVGDALPFGMLLQICATSKQR